ncbi:hypothetical protein BJF78_28380 [Pseudonocardia sp. CNS-139]|nr:hypothetical protein BJF78_28380 [Pseudonocardia sp. CNS-139]
MARLSHGKVISGPNTAAGAPVDLHDFDFLFPQLQDDPANLLPESPDTVKKLKDLGAVMVDPALGDVPDETNNSEVAAVYTYFGQFVDHDITLEAGTVGATGLVADGLEPLPVEEIRNDLRNTRTATLDLDSLYDAPAPREPGNPDRMDIGDVTSLGGGAPPQQRPPRAVGDDKNDLKRKGPSSDPLVDREALIGDPRNDENTIISQLHVAFLKAHNTLVDEGRSFDEARRILRQHYQHIVVHDYLNQICDETIVADVVDQGNRWFDPFAAPFFMPLEFAVAGFRFGHTMVRASYDFNLNFNLSRPPARSRPRSISCSRSARWGASSEAPPRCPTTGSWSGRTSPAGTCRPVAWPAGSTRGWPGRTPRSSASTTRRARTSRAWPRCSPPATCCAATCCACPPGRPWRPRSAAPRSAPPS